MLVMDLASAIVVVIGCCDETCVDDDVGSTGNVLLMLLMRDAIEGWSRSVQSWITALPMLMTDGLVSIAPLVVLEMLVLGLVT